MKFLEKVFFFTVLLLGFFAQGGLAISMADNDIYPPGADEVLIGPNGVIMPTGRILLIRKDTTYCAIKFVDMWTGKTEDDKYAKYESYFPQDDSKILGPGNIGIYKDELHSPQPRWSLFGHPVAFGEKSDIRCSPFNLWWSGKGTVYFFERGKPQRDYGIELAPTPWTDISQLNLSNPHIKWYRYDGTRKRVNFPVDKLWGERERGQ